MEFHPNSQRLSDMSLEGRIYDHVACSGEDQSLLDEPIRDTVVRSLNAVGKKFSHVLFPRRGQELLKEWDLWGPLILCLALSVLLQSGSYPENGGGPEFAQVFVIFWFGAVVVTLNSKLLGGAVSFLQTVCVLGYCILPLVLSLIICRVILFTTTDSLGLFIVRFIIVLMGLIYSSYASYVFVHPALPINRVALSIYPICLFYFFLSWLVISVPSS